MKANVMYLAAMMVTLMQYACMRSDSKSTVNATADHESAIVADCFTKLIAGETDQSGKLQSVSFGHGSCQGESVALDVFTQHSEVEIIIDGESYASPLYQEGQDLMANVAGQMKKVGNFDPNPAEAALTLASGAKIALEVGQGSSARLWKMGDSVDGKSTRIQIILQ